eukprot:CAMPEP_0197826280 /NCGR_PEP_ID=MMETSP1437-20131217/3254_1 /TAXON_ID=49252 ORGANISM="Eucampia antarctica, Strain CCMP1452" /NCGR_SAMPLE_ID=MMETSP1437 /ASSEMBLY_ACC=CAM_ASM_001096 /LENGTH=602 /DNA_ID=CAMNT_0043426649 /DNA_START=99 /DNA_END=1907 /DNA_ORIENTATION=+
MASSRSLASARNKAYALSECKMANVSESVLSVASTLRYGVDDDDDNEDNKNNEPASSSSSSSFNGNNCSVIRPLGSSRRVYLKKTAFGNRNDIWGLSHRLRILSKNASLNSVLVGSTVPLTKEEQEDGHVDIYRLPEMVRQLERRKMYISHDTIPLAKDDDNDDDDDDDFVVHSGYDPKIMTADGNHDKEDVLNAIQHLALTMRGGTFEPQQQQQQLSNSNDKSSDDDGCGAGQSKIPIISLVDGSLTNGGYALAMSSYVLATQESAFQMTYPLQGLAMDPIGFSYLLPRLGWEYNQPSARYSHTAGLLLSLCGYRADAHDMMETGLATHYMESMGKLGTLERALSELLPYYQQGILDTPVRTYTGNLNNAPTNAPTNNNNNNNNKYAQEEEDVNAEFRNVTIANLLHSFCTYDAAGQELGNHWTDERDYYKLTNELANREDPSLNFGDNDASDDQLYHDRTSDLVTLAATLDPIFNEENSVHGIMERFQQVIADCQNNIHNQKDVAEEQECMEYVQKLLQHMQASSPLALRAIYRLHQVGKDSAETLESCMDREKAVQLKLYQQQDFATYNNNNNNNNNKSVSWKHASVNDVTDDEVEELL